MGFAVTEPREKSRRTKPTSPRKTASGEFFAKPNRTRLENRRQPLKTQVGKPTYAYKIASGRPFWPSRDPIEEQGGLNLYGFVSNDGINNMDLNGLFLISHIHDGKGITGKLTVSVSVSCDKGAQIASAVASGYEVVLGAGFEFQGNATLTKDDSTWGEKCGEGKCYKTISYRYDWQLFWKLKFGIGNLSGGPFGWESIGDGNAGASKTLCCEKK